MIHDGDFFARLLSLPYLVQLPAIIIVCVVIGRFGLLLGRGAAGMTMIRWRSQLRWVEFLEVAFGWVWSLSMMAGLGFMLPIFLEAPPVWIILTPALALTVFFAYSRWRDSK